MRVLLVEDADPDARLVREHLAEVGEPSFLVERVETLGAGIDLLEERTFDVVLLDLSLPDSSSEETFPRFDSLRRRPPVVLLTGLGDEETAAELVRSGAEEYLPKSVLAPAPLARAIRHAIEREALEEQLRNTQRHQVVAELAGGLAHHFNNLLTVILGEAELAAERAGEDTELAASVSAIEAAARRAAELGRQLRLLSHHRTEQVAPLRLEKLLAEAAPMLEAALGDGGRLSLRAPDREAWVVADRFRLQMVFLSLATNAQEAMGSGGALTIEITEDPRGQNGSGALSSWLVRVSDEGPGVTDDMRERIFEPFLTTKPERGASGLGLTVARTVIERLGGEIELERSRPHACFRLILPAHHPGRD